MCGEGVAGGGSAGGAGAGGAWGKEGFAGGATTVLCAACVGQGSAMLGGHSLINGWPLFPMSRLVCLLQRDAAASAQEAATAQARYSSRRAGLWLYQAQPLFACSACLQVQ